MDAVRGGFEKRRRVNVGNAKLVQIRHERERVGQAKMLVELETIGRAGNLHGSIVLDVEAEPFAEPQEFFRPDF
jgi:hypothetical protein